MMTMMTMVVMLLLIMLIANNDDDDANIHDDKNYGTFYIGTKKKIK